MTAPIKSDADFSTPLNRLNPFARNFWREFRPAWGIRDKPSKKTGSIFSVSLDFDGRVHFGKTRSPTERERACWRPDHGLPCRPAKGQQLAYSMLQNQVPMASFHIGHMQATQSPRCLLRGMQTHPFQFSNSRMLAVETSGHVRHPCPCIP